MQHNVITGVKQIATIRLFPIVSSGDFDIHRAFKDWAMPATEHDYDSPDDPDFCVFDILVVKNGEPSWGRKMMSRADAILANPIPSGYPYPPGFTVPASIPWPVNLKAMPAGYELGTGMMGNPTLVPSIPVADPGTPTAFTVEIKDKIFAIAAKLGGVVVRVPVEESKVSITEFAEPMEVSSLGFGVETMFQTHADYYACLKLYEAEGKISARQFTHPSHYFVAMRVLANARCYLRHETPSQPHSVEALLSIVE